ncbi:kinase-like domain-containing protein [Aspergillus venezuelensis]
MLPSLLRSLPRSPLRKRWTPLNFNNPNYGLIHPDQKIEEETVPDYIASKYYPMKIGEVIKDRYQVVTKLGFGITSTVWLARDMEYQKYVTLKILIDKASMGKYVDDELNIYKRTQSRDAIRSLTDSFDINGAEHKHRCFVHPPLFESVWAFLHRNPIGRLPVPLLAVTLKRLFQALDYLHTECCLIHTDISATNLLFTYKDNSAFAQAEEEELQDPSPRKEVDDNRLIYLFRDLFKHTEDIQPNHYRAPEVILGVPWSYEVDIWNVGCMIWDIFQGKSLFTGYDPEHEAYRSRAHLAGWLLRGVTPLEEWEMTLKDEGDREDREMFTKERATAGESVDDEWIVKHSS